MMQDYLDICSEILDIKARLSKLEMDKIMAERDLRKSVECFKTLSNDWHLRYKGKSWIAKKSPRDWTISVYTVLKSGKTSKKRVAETIFGGINQVRLLIALEIIK